MKNTKALESRRQISEDKTVFPQPNLPCIVLTSPMQPKQTQALPDNSMQRAPVFTVQHTPMPPLSLLVMLLLKGQTPLLVTLKADYSAMKML